MPKQTNGRVVPETGQIEYIYDDMLITGGNGGSQTNDDPYGDSCCVSNIPGPPGKNAFENIDKDINFNNYKIINLGDATDPQDGMNLISTERLLNNFLFGDVIGDLYSPKTVVGLQGRPITEDTPFNNASLIWDEAQQMWVYGKGGGGTGSFEISKFEPLYKIYEIGQESVKPVFTTTYKGTPTTASLIDNINNVEKVFNDNFNSVSSDFTFKSDIHGSEVVFKLTSVDEFETVANRETVITWGTMAYWGGFLSSIDYADMIELSRGNANHSLLLEPYNDIEVTATGDEYIYYFHRADYSEFHDTATFTVNSITGGFELIDEYIHVNEFGVPVTYSVFKSEQKNLGKIKIQIRSDYRHESAISGS